VTEIERLVALAADVGAAAQERLAAFGRIVRRFQDMAYGCAYAVLGDFHLAEDAAQEAFLTAYLELPGLREPRSFPGWLRRIVMTQCSRIGRRKQPRTASLTDALQVASEQPLPPEAAEKRELCERVLAAVRALPDAQRMATTLFYVNGYSHKEIAEFLEVPVTTVKKQLFASRNSLRERMTAMVDESLKSRPLPERFADVVVQLRYVSERINPQAEALRVLSAEALRERSGRLRRRLAEGDGRDGVRAEAFALAREATRRALGMEHYDVQLVAALMLEEGWIAEEAAGEGKTITAFPAVYMAVLEGMRVHVVTVNDYLARRDAAMARRVFELLGVTVRAVTVDMAAGPPSADHRAAYQADVIYGTGSEFIFDHLRDGLRGPGADPVQGPLDFAIVDEADSVLLDEARTPCIISRREELDGEICRRADAAAAQLIAQRQASGIELYRRDPANERLTDLAEAGLAAIGQGDVDWPHRVRQALRARLLYQRDAEYVVDGGRVVIVDAEVGRARVGRQWSDGLHQAIEAKEGVPFSPEYRELASIRVQDYFRKYKKLAGMTGTAATAAKDFRQDYGLAVAVVPTRRPVNRVDYPDRLYATGQEKLDAIAQEVRRYSCELGRPVLVGAGSIEMCQKISARLRGFGIRHEVLDARPANAAREAQIVAAAGKRRPAEDGRPVGAVVVATAMAGRGTDIELDRDVVDFRCYVPSAARLAELAVAAEELFPPGSVKCCIHCGDHDAATGCAHCFKPKLGPAFPSRGRSACRQEVPCGLHVVGAECAPCRRLDNQLRARAGAQGQPGSSRFFACLEDPLLAGVADELKAAAGAGLAAGEPVDGSTAAGITERAQKDAEGRDRDIRRRCAARREADR